MTFRIQRLHLAAVEIEALFVISYDAARRFNGLNLTVHFLGSLDAVNRLCAGYQSRRVDHVRDASWVNYASSVRQFLHEQTRAACMIKVNVREKNKIDIANIEALLMQRVNQQRYAVVCSGIDERGAPALYDQMARVLQGPRVLRIDGGDAIIELDRLGAIARQALFRLGGFEPIEAREVFSQDRNIFFVDQRCLGAHNRLTACALAVSF